MFVAVNVAGLSTEWRLPAGDAMGAVPLLLLAMPKTSERRAEHAIQRKLDAIARAMLEQQEGTRGKAHEDLKDAIRMEERLQPAAGRIEVWVAIAVHRTAMPRASQAR
ncbi:hypothetical protein ACFV9E_13845 [Streptomyces sp. NPDC059835]|uniref:hypothetical protein n=1 Tax=Streptomyces sp. NPDC059835 TaxID=3346967 RepID=UPI00365354B7